MVMSKKKKIFIMVGVLLAVFVLLNLNYFISNFQFFFHGYTKNYNDQPNTVAHVALPANTVEIDDVGIKAPIVYITGKTEKDYQAGLINGVVHFPGTANPGQPGNCYIFGHSSDFIWSKGHYKTVFTLLPKVELGSEIYISDDKGISYTYIITASQEVAADDLSVLDQQGYKKKMLTLQTSYPIGTALARWIVVAEMKE